MASLLGALQATVPATGGSVLSCLLGRGCGMFSLRQLASFVCRPQPSPPAPGHLTGTEEHRVPAQSPKHVLGKQGDPMAKQPSESPGALLTKYYSQHKFVKPSGTSRLSFILSGFLCGPQLLTSHEKIQSVDARLLRYQPLALGGLESISPSSNASSTTCCL